MYQCLRILPLFLALSWMALMGYAQVENGKASYYSDAWRGRRTSSGERYNPDSLTCAHRTHPFGTYLRVTNAANAKEVIVKVNDRGPFISGRVVDLSGKAAKTIDMLNAGIAVVTAEPVPSPYLPTPPDTGLPFRHLHPFMPTSPVAVCNSKAECAGRPVPEWEFILIEEEEPVKKRRRRR